jgi:hypothetical protein
VANQQTIPFTYLVGWSSHNLYYYGVRYATGCHPNDLWTTYFTSSNYVKSTREKLGEPDIIQIRKTFIDKKKASNWETRVLKKIKIFENTKYLNKQINGNWVMDDETKRKISSTMKGMKRPEEVRLKMSKSKLGKHASIEVKEKMSKARRNKPLDDKYKESLRKASLKYWEGVRNGTILRKGTNT